MHIDGACHCGAVSFTAEIDPSRVALCHCTDCRVLSGSAFRFIVPVPVERFSVRGATKSYGWTRKLPRDEFRESGECASMFLFPNLQ